MSMIVAALTYVIFSLMREVRPSRLLMGMVLPVWLAVGMIERVAVRSLLRWFRRRGWNLRHAAIVGTGRAGQKLVHAMRRIGYEGDYALEYEICDLEPIETGLPRWLEAFADL
jgi:FlaA1/EpsC-like NDP-sugar epimerase